MKIKRSITIALFTLMVLAANLVCADEIDDEIAKMKALERGDDEDMYEDTNAPTEEEMASLFADDADPRP